MTCPFQNPRRLHADLAKLRQKPNIEYSETLGGSVVSRYDDIIQVLDQPEIFSSRATVPEFPPPVKGIFANKVPEKGTLLAWDNPDHDRLRKSVASFFVPRRLERFQPLLRATAHELIDSFIDSGSVNIRDAFALPLPLQTIVAIAGLDEKRWQWIGRCLALFGGITDTESDTSIEQRVQDVLDLHEYVAKVIQDRRKDRRDDLISHIWNERDSGNVEMTDFEHLSMIPGLLLAGHETTTNLLSMGLAHLLHHGLWEKASRSDDTRRQAIEELLRFESAITGMHRVVTKETTVSGKKFEPGEKVFVAYNSGSRDDTRFADPNRLDITRRSTTQHLGFGRGIHACLGAPFARLLLRTELSVLAERLPNLRLITTYEKIEYEKVQSGRGVKNVVLAWDPSSPQSTKKSLVSNNLSSSTKRTQNPENWKLAVEEARIVAKDVLEITLKIEDHEFPTWTPGAHIDVSVGLLGFRQYSICSDPTDRSCLRIAVLREDRGSGGSCFVHKSAKAGTSFEIRSPRNNFQFEPGSRRTVLIAGGIGITPILPMAAAAKSAGLDYSILYLGRSRAGMAYLDALTQEHGDRVIAWASGDHDGKRFDLEAFLHTETTEGLRVYCCGPTTMLDSIESILANAPPEVLRMERFSNQLEGIPQENTAFDVVLAQSGRKLHVPANKTMLDVINKAGGNILSTCNKGVCGTCEVRVLKGVPEHRDVVLTQSEKNDNSLMMACVSRCRGNAITLDLW
jgi:cytochrome P450/ferredoxin-NADP reductase